MQKSVGATVFLGKPSKRERERLTTHEWDLYAVCVNKTGRACALPSHSSSIKAG